MRREPWRLHLLTQFLPLLVFRINQSSRMDQIWSDSRMWETGIFWSWSCLPLPSVLCYHPDLGTATESSSSSEHPDAVRPQWLCVTGPGWAPQEGRLDCPPASLQLLLVPGVPWSPVAAWPQPHDHLFSVSVRCLLPSRSVWPCIRISPFYKDTRDIRSDSDKTLTQLPLSRSGFQIKSHPEVLGGGDHCILPKGYGSI